MTTKKSTPLDRRQVVALSVGLSSTLLLRCRTTQSKSALRDESDGGTGGRTPASGFVRKAVGSLTADSPEIVAYKAGVRAMRARPDTAFNSWIFQAEIHRNSCPHSNWFFLPWHRMYLYWFEQICRDASSDATFALPYWDWATSSQIPDFFYDDPDLNDPSRDLHKGETFVTMLQRQNPTVGADQIQQFVDQVFAPASIRGIMATTRFLEFGSGRSNVQRGQAATGSLEGGPHNTAHGLIGGNMGQVPLSPRDPIFWLHHCNIDRLWAEWAQGKGAAALPPDPGEGEADQTLTSDLWQRFTLNGFSDMDGRAKTMQVSEVLNTAALGYAYDTLTGASLKLTDDAGAPPPKPKSIKSFNLKKEGPPLGAAMQSPSVGGSAPEFGKAFRFDLDVPADLDPAVAKVLAGSAAYYPVLRMSVTGIPMPVDTSKRACLTFLVGGVPIGSFSFFDHGMDGNTNDSMSAAYDLGPALKAMQDGGARRDDWRSLSVTMVVVGADAFSDTSALGQIKLAVTCFQ